MIGPAGMPQCPALWLDARNFKIAKSESSLGQPHSEPATTRLQRCRQTMITRRTKCHAERLLARGLALDATRASVQLAATNGVGAPNIPLAQPEGDAHCNYRQLRHPPLAPF